MDNWTRMMTEQEIRQLFESYAIRKGFDITRDEDYSFFYKESNTEDVWRAFHVGFVRGVESK